jgi:hypothetical protein
VSGDVATTISEDISDWKCSVLKDNGEGRKGDKEKTYMFTESNLYRSGETFAGLTA